MKPRLGDIWGKAPVVLLAAIALAASCAGLALGERHQQGNLIVALDGQISPRVLPRDGLAPAKVGVSSRLNTSDGSLPPRVVRIELAFAGGSMRFDRAGLPACPMRRIRNATDVQALARCGSALVGHGRLDAILSLPHQGPSRVHARLLDFNGRSRGGGRAVLIHAFSRRPPASFVLQFVAHRDRGGLPNVLTAAVPAAAGKWMHLTGFRMDLGRGYRGAGGPHSYLNASCPVPPHFTAGFFPFARIAYTFAGGRQIRATIIRACGVRK
jgi:hypothetical protein